MIDKGQTGRSKTIPVTISTRDKGFYVKFDALMDEEETFEAEIPQYVTDKGYEISDNIYTKAKELKMTLMISESPITWKSLKGNSTGEEHVENVLSDLKNLFYKRVPIDIQTSRNNFLNFGIERLVIPKTIENGYSREVEAVFREIKTTSLDTTDIEHNDYSADIDLSMVKEGGDLYSAIIGEMDEKLQDVLMGDEEYLIKKYGKEYAQNIIALRNTFKSGEISEQEYRNTLISAYVNLVH